MSPRKKKRNPDLKLYLPETELLPDKIADLLRQEIIAGKFPLGGKLSEEGLSSMLRVSRTPIRQAFYILEREGLVELIPRRGAFVAHLTQRDGEELYEIIGMIESFVVQQLIAGGKVNLAPLQKNLGQMEREINKKNLKGIIQANFSFHWELVKLAGNKRLLTLYNSVRNPTRIFQSIGLMSQEDWMESLQDHVEIAAALRRCDAEAAARLCRNHSLNRGRRVTSYLFGHREGSRELFPEMTKPTQRALKKT